MPGLTVDAKVSRHMARGDRRSCASGARPAYPTSSSSCTSATTGTSRPAQYDELLQLVKDVPRVVVFNLKEPRRWEAANNLIIADTVRRYPNAVLIDWRAASSTHPEYFGADGIHIGAAGARAYTQLDRRTAEAAAGG